ncbi:hypothetical protein BJV74DRAFT_462103 [Russula compacta]|nr:hypothetical protein BJV74DRAFT_462103 [Russula compacta]
MANNMMAINHIQEARTNKGGGGERKKKKRNGMGRRIRRYHSRTPSSGRRRIDREKKNTHFPPRCLSLLPCLRTSLATQTLTCHLCPFPTPTHGKYLRRPTKTKKEKKNCATHVCSHRSHWCVRISGPAHERKAGWLPNANERAFLEPPSHGGRVNNSVPGAEPRGESERRDQGSGEATLPSGPRRAL